MKLTTSCTGIPLCLYKPLTTLLSYILLLILFNTTAQAQQTQNQITGTVTDARTDQPVIGATIKLKGVSLATHTDEEGRFTLPSNRKDGVLEVSHLGYQVREFEFAATSQPLMITLEPNDNVLEEVQVSTGYQTIPKERATGSFVHIDNELLNRSVGSNVLDRLRGVTRGLIFNDYTLTGTVLLNNQSKLAIRGRSTLFSNAEPLIVVDNFPYEGDINSINPDDVESITLLQDAAAASAWGAYAGNGVIVITTRKGQFHQPTRVSLSGDISVSDKPNLYYVPTMSSADYIEVEKFLFENGAYDGRINDGYSYISPTIEALDKHRKGSLTDAQLTQLLKTYSNHNIREDLRKYVYRPASLQKSSISLNGGTEHNAYTVSVGWDQNLATIKGTKANRITIHANNRYRLADDRLTLTLGLMLASERSKTGNAPYDYPVMYAALADSQGNPLSVGGQSLRYSYVDTAGQGLLRDWHYRPLDDLYQSLNRQVSHSYQLNSSLTYRIAPWLSATGRYQFTRDREDLENLVKADAFQLRNLYNTFAVIDYHNGSASSAIPDGDILDQQGISTVTHRIRGQFSGHKSWHGHEIHGTAGIDVSSREASTFVAETWYGYQKETESYVPVDYQEYYQQYHLGFPDRLPGQANASRKRSVSRNRSYFANLSYEYLKRYVFTASVRKDEANIFGVTTNLKGVPLWSIGTLWKISREPFYRIDCLPELSFRITYGYNGNVNKGLSAYVTSQVNMSPNIFGDLYQWILNPPNPQLRWEKVRMFNAAIDFALTNRKLSGTIEVYSRSSTDLISSAPLRPSTGRTTYTGNFASLKAWGADLELHADNRIGRLQWQASLLSSYMQDRVTSYELDAPNTGSYLSLLGQYPIVGKPLYPLFSYPWNGLDENGNPGGYLHGEASTAYTQILSESDLDELVYHGRATPAYSGSLRNTFTFDKWDFSFNLTYKGGYYFRRHSINYSDLYNIFNYTYNNYNPDYAVRWQQPGDEQKTQVPSSVYPSIPGRDQFYQRSSALVERGDHLRLQDARISYTLSSSRFTRLGVKEIKVYLYASNLGIIWAANDHGIDPDVVPNTTLVFASPRNYAFGFNLIL